MNRKNIRPPRFAEWITACFARTDEKNTVLGDIEEYYKELADDKGTFRAGMWYRLQVLKMTLQFTTHSTRWSVIMLHNYIRTAFRNLFRHKGYSLINIAGLAAGVACCLFILLYVEQELSYDSYHKDADRIYRIANEQKTSNGFRYYSAILPVLGSAVREKLPQVESLARLTTSEEQTVKYGQKSYYEDRLAFTDPGIFDIFTISFIRGTRNDALKRPFTVIITEQIAGKYFGAEDPVGKILKIGVHDAEVTGVIEDSPENTHYKFGILGTINTLETIHSNDERDRYHAWTTGNHNAHTYVKLAAGADPGLFIQQVNNLAYENLTDELAAYGYTHHYFLQPLRSIHLHSNLRGEAEAPGNPQYVYVFSAVGFLILLIACINFMNLATARSATRAAEVGMRKVVGAHRRQLVFQFMTESFLISMIAVAAALTFIALTLPLFNEFAGTQFHIAGFLRRELLAGLAAIAVFTGLTAGSYPAFFLSAFRPSAILKGAFTAKSGSAVMRKLLVVIQFTISIILITGTLIIFNQITYMKNRSLGFSKEQKLVISLPRASMVRDDYETIKTELLGHASITGATASSSVPGRRTFYWRMWPPGERDTESQPINFMNIDYDFIREFDIGLVAGRTFDRAMGTDLAAPGFVINEAAVTAFGWETPENALDKELNENRTPIIGVVRNFHFKGLQNDVEPIGMSVWSDHFMYITLSVNTGNLDGVIKYTRDVYHRFFPDDLFDYFFLDTDFNRQYRFEEHVSRLFSVFTFLGIFIAALGLFGLASFIAQQRTKEIGILKVFGATVISIVLLLTKEFVKWIVIAAVIAWPVSYFVMNSWLQNFAFRASPGWTPFVLAAVSALIIALVSVSYQTIRAAAANPVDSLRYE